MSWNKRSANIYKCNKNLNNKKSSASFRKNKIYSAPRKRFLSKNIKISVVNFTISYVGSWSGKISYELCLFLLCRSLSVCSDLHFTVPNLGWVISLMWCKILQMVIYIYLIWSKFWGFTDEFTFVSCPQVLSWFLYLQKHYTCTNKCWNYQRRNIEILDFHVRSKSLEEELEMVSFMHGYVFNF